MVSHEGTKARSNRREEPLALVFAREVGDKLSNQLERARFAKGTSPVFSLCNFSSSCLRVTLWRSENLQRRPESSDAYPWPHFPLGAWKCGLRKTLLSFFLILFAFSICNAEPTKTEKHKSMITIETLEGMFANICAKTKWNMDGDMLWGYFFTDPDPKKLEPLAKYLSENGYRIVSIYPADDNSIHWLHVERVEHHTVKTLDARNKELYALATKFGIRSYDGMDVGPLPHGTQ